MNLDNNYDVIVIGGGASGMMAAISAARNGASVLLLEKNKRLGEKLRITGGGRCNIWNQEHDIRLLLANYGNAEKFLYAAFARFGLDESIEFFNNLGLETKVEARKRAFPTSEKAEDVVDALIKEIHKLGVDVRLRETVIEIRKERNNITELVTHNGKLFAKNYILATGGSSRPETGSTGDGFSWLKELGHTVDSPTPTITPLAVQDKWIKSLSGTTMKDIRIIFYADKKLAFKLDGDVLATHFGISGPLILNNAYKVSDLLQTGEVTAIVDLYPQKDPKILDEKILEVLDQHRTKQLKNIIRFMVPDGTSSAVIELLKPIINMDTTASEINKQQRKVIVTQLKNMPLKITGLMGFDKAVVADGGLDLKQLDTRTMQSRIVSNLYVTGDLQNINRPSGGFSLQLCWTTGYIAGISASSQKK